MEGVAGFPGPPPGGGAAASNGGGGANDFMPGDPNQPGPPQFRKGQVHK